MIEFWFPVICSRPTRSNEAQEYIQFESEGSKSSTHYLGDKNRFDVSSKGPSSGISVGGSGKTRVFLYK